MIRCHSVPERPSKSSTPGRYRAAPDKLIYLVSEPSGDFVPGMVMTLVDFNYSRFAKVFGEGSTFRRGGQLYTLRGVEIVDAQGQVMDWVKGNQFMKRRYVHATKPTSGD